MAGVQPGHRAVDSFGQRAEPGGDGAVPESGGVVQGFGFGGVLAGSVGDVGGGASQIDRGAFAAAAAASHALAMIAIGCAGPGGDRRVRSASASTRSASAVRPNPAYARASSNRPGAATATSARR